MTLANLRNQFPGRGDDQDLNAGFVFLGESLDDREEKRRRFACAGFSTANQICSVMNNRDRLLLNRSRTFKSLIFAFF